MAPSISMARACARQLVFDSGTKSSYYICIHVADQNALAFEQEFIVITVLNAEVIYVPIIIKP